MNELLDVQDMINDLIMWVEKYDHIDKSTLLESLRGIDTSINNKVDSYYSELEQYYSDDIESSIPGQSHEVG